MRFQIVRDPLSRDVQTARTLPLKCASKSSATRIELEIGPSELELKLIQFQMAQKPMLRVEVGARALRNQAGGEGGVGWMQA